MNNPKLSSPIFNVREIAKQMLLLEDHLTDISKRCGDCIKKHLLMIEGLAEEGMSLDTQGIWTCRLKYIANKSRSWMMNFSDGNDPADIAQDIRYIRKQITNIVYDPRSIK